MNSVSKEDWNNHYPESIRTLGVICITPAMPTLGIQMLKYHLKTMRGARDFYHLNLISMPYKGSLLLFTTI